MSRFQVGQHWRDEAGLPPQRIIAITDHAAHPRVVTMCTETGMIFDYSMSGQLLSKPGKNDLVSLEPSDPILASVEDIKGIERFNGMDTQPATALYTMQYRPVSPWTLPGGLSYELVGAPYDLQTRPDLPRSKFPFGTFKSGRALTRQEMHDFEIEEVSVP